MRLLIISSSKAQATEPASPIPAFERYRGLTFAVLKKLRREEKMPKDLEILIVSAEFGLIRPEKKIPYVDHLMTSFRAWELRKGFLEKIRTEFTQKKYSEIFVNLGTKYAQSIEGIEEFVDARVTYASGTFGKRVGQMKQWVLKTGRS